MPKAWIAVGAINALLSVAAGAFGAHALTERLSPKMLANFEVAARYQMYHALAILLTVLLARAADSRMGDAACWLFLAGIVLFSGSLYALSLSGITKLGMITPLGGLAFMLGWLLLAIAAFRSSSATASG